VGNVSAFTRTEEEFALLVLRTVPLTNDEIHAFSFGRVDNPLEIDASDWRQNKRSLFDPAIFGYDRDWQCACGKYRGKAHEGLICDRCGVKIGASRRLRQRRFGHIDLSYAVPHPLASDSAVSTIPVLPIAYRARLPGGADLDALYIDLVRASQSATSDANGARGASVEHLGQKVSELYCNEWLVRPRTVDGRTRRSLAHFLVDSINHSPARIGVLVRALGLKLDLHGQELL
jgi:hypothetical protein